MRDIFRNPAAVCAFPNSEKINFYMPDAPMLPPDDSIVRRSPRITGDPDFWIKSQHCAIDGCIGYEVDTYGGVIFDTTSLPTDAVKFQKILDESMGYLFTQGMRKGFWLRLSMEQIDFVPICIKKLGFYIHHAMKNYVMLVKWTDDSRPNPIPNPPMHQVRLTVFVLPIMFSGRNRVRNST